MCFCVIIKGIKYLLKLSHTGAIGKLLFNTSTKEFCYGLREGRELKNKDGDIVASTTVTDKGWACNGHLFAVVGIVSL